MTKRTCKVCGKEYSYCPRCEADMNKPTWMLMFHDANCRKIFDTLQRHFTKEYTNAQALKILKECDLSHMKNFNNKLQEEIQAILDTAPKRKTRKIVNNEPENS